MLNKRWITSLALLLIIVFAWPTYEVSAQTPGSTTVYVNGKRVSTTAIIQNDYQLVPASFFRSMNVSVEWSKSYHSAVLSTSSIQIGFPIAQRHTDYQIGGASVWKRDNLNTRTTLINGVTYVPLAYTAQKLGFSVQYDARVRAALISTGAGDITALENKKQPTQDELHWLYQITEAEAGGESYTGKAAVAASILNRVADPEWPNSIIDTIFQVDYYNGRSYYQFSPVLDNRINTVTPSQDTIRAVQAALNGYDPGLGAVVFYNPNKTDNEWVRSREVTAHIGNHVFAK
ncbi:cell wall hydrolase [Paenibacillus endoradicis]|uniref:cell wall hydrolase n=1 Tax=Paenibacillus endoradicis TaxID=2972487 RepID=UPI002158D2AC|nr:cell wall hydrolase [Paenibacillus endoradicis]MCR8657082.1 cell wall hydrolase [Paenibacillus endoradicis]